MSSKKTSRPGASASAGADSATSQPPRQIGEGSYEGTRDYQKSIKTYLDDADVASDARAAKPANEDEAIELKQAEQQGRSHSKAKGQ
ncbi:hypothetical protein [Polaromonas sp.]|uniref:hypothetical protein n=1 Tax=Polaromonas sp. TaxID=1869339 RepID=UPI0032665CCE